MRILGALFISVYCLPALLNLFAFGDYIIRQDYYAEVLCVNKNKPELACNGKCQIKNFTNQVEKGTEKPILPASLFKVFKVDAIFYIEEISSSIADCSRVKVLHYFNKMPKIYFIENFFVPPELNMGFSQRWLQTVLL